MLSSKRRSRSEDEGVLLPPFPAADGAMSDENGWCHQCAPDLLLLIITASLEDLPPSLHHFISVVIFVVPESMRLLLPATMAAASLLCGEVVAFAPPSPSFAARRPSTMTRSLGVDPFHFADLAHQMGSLQDAFGSLNLADAMDAVADTASDIVQEPAAAADNGWFGFLTVPIRGFLQIIHTVLAATGMGNAWGVSIIVLTILIKVFTFPLTKTQLESTNKMQAMQPAIKEIQAKYQSNPEVMNQKIAEFYQTNEINPLAGCLPSLVQIPVFIGLYRAVLDLAKDNQLNESFLFLPNLEGPTYGADPATASDWILKGWYVPVLW